MNGLIITGWLDGWINGLIKRMNGIVIMDKYLVSYIRPQIWPEHGLMSVGLVGT